MKLQLVDPTVSSTLDAHYLAPRLNRLDGLRIGLLTNGKVNADLLISETAELFVTNHGCSVLEMRSKPSASRPAVPELLDELSRDSDFLITAVGD